VGVRIYPRIWLGGESISKNAFRWFESDLSSQQKSTLSGAFLLAGMADLDANACRVNTI